MQRGKSPDPVTAAQLRGVEASGSAEAEAPGRCPSLWALWFPICKVEIIIITS